uniref:Kinesin-like protein n=1 Tax=Alexandrium monilatum TaxID=311494 RepID=A0A7S4S105_9DINO
MPKDGSTNIRAVVRVRPLLLHELERGEEACCQVKDENTCLVRLGTTGNQWRQYSFDACLPNDRSQKQVFQECGVTSLLDSAVIGYSATVLAYGQTGSGKTHSMIGKAGTPDGAGRGEEVKRDDGLVMRAAKRLFKRISSDAAQLGTRFSVSASFTEIYNAPGAVNECISDLLNPDVGNLQVRHSQKRGFFISDLNAVECNSVADVRGVLEAGVQTRKVAAHALNKDSSRSHALFTLYIDSESNSTNEEAGPQGRRHGKITFVDLAGSERLKESLAEGNARKETQAINKSLFTLGQVISLLAQGKAEKHVPYRNSKLTQLLQESFGGESLCLMVTCISPSTKFAEESINSLNYAQKAMNIRNRPVVCLDEKEQLVHDLKTENAALRKELEEYRMRFAATAGMGVGGATGLPVSLGTVEDEQGQLALQEAACMGAQQASAGAQQRGAVSAEEEALEHARALMAQEPRRGVNDAMAAEKALQHARELMAQEAAAAAQQHPRTPATASSAPPPPAGRRGCPADGSSPGQPQKGRSGSTRGADGGRGGRSMRRSRSSRPESPGVIQCAEAIQARGRSEPPPEPPDGEEEAAAPAPAPPPPSAPPPVGVPPPAPSRQPPVPSGVREASSYGGTAARRRQQVEPRRRPLPPLPGRTPPGAPGAAAEPSRPGSASVAAVRQSSPSLAPSREQEQGHLQGAGRQSAPALGGSRAPHDAKPPARATAAATATAAQPAPGPPKADGPGEDATRRRYASTRGSAHLPQLTAAQMERLDGSHPSEWQVDFNRQGRGGSSRCGSAGSARGRSAGGRSTGSYSAGGTATGGGGYGAAALARRRSAEADRGGCRSGGAGRSRASSRFCSSTRSASPGSSPASFRSSRSSDRLHTGASAQGRAPLGPPQPVVGKFAAAGVSTASASTTGGIPNFGAAPNGGGPGHMSLVHLHSKLSSMQMATNSLVGVGGGAAR